LLFLVNKFGRDRARTFLYIRQTGALHARVRASAQVCMHVGACCGRAGVRVALPMSQVGSRSIWFARMQKKPSKKVEFLRRSRLLLPYQGRENDCCCPLPNKFRLSKIVLFGLLFEGFDDVINACCIFFLDMMVKMVTLLMVGGWCLGEEAIDGAGW